MTFDAWEAWEAGVSDMSDMLIRHFGGPIEDFARKLLSIPSDSFQCGIGALEFRFRCVWTGFEVRLRIARIEDCKE